MNTRNATLAAALLLAAIASGIGIGRAVATGAPTQAPLTYAGTLTDQDGKPYATAQDVTLKVFDAASGGTAKCTANTVQAEAATGNFQVTLPDDCVQAVRDQSELWTELTVGATKTVLPRTKLGAVPYALEADTAKVAGSAAAASGALKTQVEGIVADVVGLKAKPGTVGMKVKDATGAVLGDLVTLTTSGTLTVATSTGHVLGIDWTGKSYNNFFFEEGGCTGKAFTQAGFFSGTVVGVANAKLATYFVVSGPIGQACIGAASKSSLSYWVSGDVACQSSANTIPSACVVESATGAQLGLPDKIVGPLSYVP